VIIVDLEPIVGHEQSGERRALVVSYEPFHASARVTICPITAARSQVRYPNEVAIPAGEAGQTKPGVILCHQVRTISMLRIRGLLRSSGSPAFYVTDSTIRARVRGALARHLGLDMPPEVDGAPRSRSRGR
jgi:mRNA-degrading endonuclease toxin of MazEF toxin-antitoxin module